MNEVTDVIHLLLKCTPVHVSRMQIDKHAGDSFGERGVFIGNPIDRLLQTNMHSSSAAAVGHG